MSLFSRERMVSTAAVLAIMIFGLVAIYSYTTLVANPRVAEEIRNEPDSETAGRVMLLTLPSGREIPVNYLQRDDLIFVGADGRWWRELDDVDPQPVEVTLRGEILQGHATVVRDNPEYREEIFAELRPTAPLIFGVLVVISLDDQNRTA